MNCNQAATVSATPISECPDDTVWDDFLESYPAGQYQQSSLWARCKEATGWHSQRFTLVRSGEIKGGFQFLHRDTRFGRVGYLPKGPVVPGEHVDILDQTVEILLRQAHDAGLAALVVQAPDDSKHTANALRRQGLRDAPFLGVIESTLVLPLDGGARAIEQRMHQKTRRRVRQAREQKVAVREGGKAELSLFFDLMLASCRRQGSGRPNPSSLDALQAVWAAFRGEGKIRLTLAEQRGKTCAGLICLCFGKRFSLWKKGWAGEGGHPGANYLLHDDAISWAKESGFEYCDFESLRPDIAESLARGGPLSPEQRKSRDYFNIRFGGVPKRLPPAMFFIRNPLLRHACSAVGPMRFLMRAARGFRASSLTAAVLPPRP